MGTGGKMIIAVDFDGTVVEHKFPDIGDPIAGAIDTIKELIDAGHQIILWTCREDHPTDASRQHLTEAVYYMEVYDIELYGINEAPAPIEFRDFTPDGMSGRKVCADIYIDDKNFGGFVPWSTIRNTLLQEL